MKINNLSISNFRNIRQLEINSFSSLNIIYGGNAQGKTNLLESIYFLAYSKSFKAAPLSNLITHNFEFANVKGEVLRNDINFELAIIFSRCSKELYLNKKLVNIEQYIGNIHIFLYLPFSTFIYGGPKERRQYLDRAIVSLDKKYVNIIANYRRVIKMRNALFKKNHSKKEWEAWNEQLIKFSIEIWKHRLAYIKELAKEINSLKGMFFPEKDEIELGLKTEPSLSLDQDRWFQEMEIFLNENRANEEKYGFSIYGPHRDDMIILHNSYEAKNFCSSGQLKAIVLLLTLGQLNLFYNKFQEFPVLICDDIDAEIDNKKLHSFLSMIKKEIQVFLTVMQKDFFSNFRTEFPIKFYEMKEGRIIDE